MNILSFKEEEKGPQDLITSGLSPKQQNDFF